MFNSIYITPAGNNRLDLGLLAEILVFYDKVHLLASETMLRDLFKSCKPELVIELIEEEILEINYLHNMLGVSHKDDQFPKEYSFTSFYSPDHSLDKITEKIFFELIGRKGRSRRLAVKFNRFVKTEYYEKNINEDSIQYFLDDTFVNDGAKIVLNNLLPEYNLSKENYFKTEKGKSGILVNTNIDIEKANSIFSKKYPNQNLSIALILSFLFNTKGYLHFSSRFNDEIAADELNTALIQKKFYSIINHHLHSKEQLSLFQDFVFNEAKKIREAVNSGEVKFEELIEVFKKAKRFKSWLADIESEKSLLKEYFKEVTSDSLIDKLPGKTFRWSLFTGAGILINLLSGSPAIGTVSGLSLGAFDSFIFDKLVKGWKPNQFINMIDNKLKT